MSTIKFYQRKLKNMKMQEYWIPETPAKNRPARPQEVYEQVKDQKSQNDGSLNSGSDRLIDLNKSICDWEDIGIDACGYKDHGDSRNSLREAALAAEKETRVQRGEPAYFIVNSLGYSGEREGDFRWQETTNITGDTMACTNNVVRSLDFRASGECLDEWNAPLDSAPSTGSLNCCSSMAPPAFQESEIATTQAEASQESPIAPIKDVIENLLPEQRNPLLSLDLEKGTSNPESHVTQCDQENEKVFLAPKTPVLKHNANKRPRKGIDVNQRPLSKIKKHRHRPKIAGQGKSKRLVKNSAENNKENNVRKTQSEEKKENREHASKNQSMEKKYVRKTESKKRQKPSTQQTSVIVGMQSDVGSFGGHKLLNDLDLYTNSFRWRSHGKRSVRSKIGFHRGSSWVQQLNFPKSCKRMRIKRQKKSVVSIMLGFLRLCGWMKKKRSKRFIERGNFSWLALIQMINNQILNIPLNQICSEFKKLPDPPQELGIGEGEGKVKHERNVPESSIEIPVRQALTNEEHEIPILTQNHEKKLTQNCIEIRPSPVNLKFQDVSSLKNKELQVAAKSKGPLKIFNKKGSVNQKAGDVIEELIHKFKKLKISDISAIVPYQSSDSTKKTKPKVVLDSETARRWNLLMGIDNGACKEKVDEEKQKKWEEERKIFHGRVDSFTSKMHVVLGDRRFKPWKGSVVDSVVGVFLTQNVSDFLSSSAYMSLAAKFPVKPSNKEASVDDLENKNSQGSTKARQDSDGNQYFIIEPEPKTPADMVEETSLVDIEDLGNTALPQEYHRHKNKVWRCKNSENASRGMEHMNSISNSKRLNCLNASSTSTTPSDLDDSFEMSCSSSSACHKSYNFELMEGCRVENVVEEKMSEAEVEMKGNPHTRSELNETILKTLNLVMKIRCALRSVDKTRKTTGGKKEKVKEKKVEKSDWDDLRRMYSKPRTREQTDTMDWEAVRQAPLTEIAEIIKGRGQHTIIAKRIQDFLNRVVDYHGSIDLEWLRYAPPDLVKAYLLEIPGLGLKSVECVQLLTLGNNAFPVDVNVDRISVRLGWVPLEPLPGDLQFHLLEEYPIMDSIQKYLWPRLSELDHRTLYELHYHMITFGKVFCTKKNPNCGACPMRAECRHHASAVASANIALPGPAKKGEERSIVPKIPVGNSALAGNGDVVVNPISKSFLESDKKLESELRTQNCEPFIEEPESPKIEQDIEELGTSKYIIDDEEEEIPTIKLNNDSFKENVQHFMDKYGPNLQTDNLSRALVPMPVNVNSIPMRKLKQTNRLRTEHQVYEIPDNHELLRGLEKRECDDSLPFLLAIWRAGETPDSCEPPKKRCSSQGPEICNDPTCFYCQSILEDKDEIVRGTILIPCRTAMRGRFPLNGTYFQVNEVFADHETSYNPVIVPRSSIWYLKRRTVYIGTSPSAIFRGISSITEIQENFWRGFICVRGWDSKTRQPKPLCKRFHCPPSKMDKARKRPQII